MPVRLTRPTLARALVAGAALTVPLAGCAVGPNYHRPAVATPTAFKELDGWTPAIPADGVDRGDWWAVFNDPVLDGLEKKVSISNQTLAADEAAYRQAHALVAQDRASYFPTVSLSDTNSGSGQNIALTTGLASKSVQIHSYEASVGATWAPDVWGKIRRTVEGAKASAQASAADLANAKLSAQSELATDYFQLRLDDGEKVLLTKTLDAYTRSLQITKNKYASGVAARADVLQAETTLASAKASLIDLDIQRTQMEHAIAVLTGAAPADLTIAPIDGWSPNVPTTPAAVPSLLLQRRPDVAAAERLAQNASAQIGVQFAGYFPAINLTASYGLASAALQTLFKTSNAVWSLGATATETAFNGFATHAAVMGAEAGYDEAVAQYRQTVLTAFQQVEDALSADRVLQNEEPPRAEASREADQAEQILVNEYKAGTVDYTSVVTAQATALSARQTLLTIQVERVTYEISLIEALGGGWSASQLPKS